MRGLDVTCIWIYLCISKLSLRLLKCTLGSRSRFPRSTFCYANIMYYIIFLHSIHTIHAYIHNLKFHHYMQMHGTIKNSIEFQHSLKITQWNFSNLPSAALITLSYGIVICVTQYNFARLLEREISFCQRDLGRIIVSSYATLFNIKYSHIIKPNKICPQYNSIQLHVSAPPPQKYWHSALVLSSQFSLYSRKSLSISCTQ